MKDYKKLNILVGWGVFLIATITYLLTLEPTVSFWDCGEFISASYKLEVGHPPGAPLFLLVGRVFTLFAGNNPAKVALMVNALSALVSAFTILFLFWTITHLVKRMLQKGNELLWSDKLIILGSGLVGALAYTFSDTFWFSAVEGEVYATSSLFTAIVFWAILKWENEADQRFANRWLILIAYLMGLSIGVHLLNLLAIPAIVLIYYFRKHTITPKGILIALLISAGIVGTVMYIIIPGLVKLAIQFELMFTNGFELPFFTGVFIYFALLIGAIIFGLYYTQKNRKVLANTIILIFGVICIGYSSYATIVIRSLADPPMDQNNPETMFNLLSYLNRDQYGDRPLIYGHAFNAPYEEDENGQAKIDEDKPVYVRENGKYKLVGYTQKANYEDDFNMLFPRMYSQAGDHIDAYKEWADLEDSELYKPKYDRNGQVQMDQQGNEITEPAKKPGFGDNLTFLFRYQLGHMYYRYFMWNFAGKQNDIQARNRYEINAGNWLTGIKKVDAKRLGNQSELTSEMLENKGRNTLYLLPLLLGIIGMISHFRKDKKNFWVVMSLFFFTGVAIVLYLNQTPLQPRERDYAYAGSFYAFAIWIGMAVVGLYQTARETTWNDILKVAAWGGGILIVIALYDYLSHDRLSYFWTYVVLLVFLMSALALIRYLGGLIKENLYLSGGILAICLIIPVLMAVQNWDDHDRSGRYTARDIAYNYLNSCGDQAILYTMGDNETFPVWYLQEVEEERTDIRTINLSYLNTDWYINQMRQKAYKSEPVKMTFTPEQLYFGRRDNTYLLNIPGISVGSMDMMEVIRHVANDSIQPKKFEENNLSTVDSIYYIPTKQFTMTTSLSSKMQWKMNGFRLTKGQLMSLDFMSSSNWERPICYAGTMGSIKNEQVFLGLSNFMELRGMAYTVNPINPVEINKDSTYHYLMKEFKWGGIEEGDIYLNEDCRRMYRHARLTFYNLIMAYLNDRNQNPGEDDKVKAKALLDRATELFPVSKIPYDWSVSGFIQAYGMLGETEKVRELSGQVITLLDERLVYINSLEPPFSEYLDPYYVDQTIYAVWDQYKTARQNGLTEYESKISESLSNFVTINYSRKNLTQARTILNRIVEEYTNNISYYAATRDPSVLQAVLFYEGMKDHFMSISMHYSDVEFVKRVKVRLVKADMELARAYEISGNSEKGMAKKQEIFKRIEKSYQEQDAVYALQLVHAIYVNLAQAIVKFKEHPNMQLLEGINADKQLLDNYTLYALAAKDKFYNREQMQEIMIFSWELIKFNYLSNDMESGEKQELAFMKFIQECYVNQQVDMIEFAVNTIYTDLMSNEQKYTETSSGQVAGELYYDYVMLTRFATLFRSFGNVEFSTRLEKELQRFEPLINSISNQ